MTGWAAAEVGTAELGDARRTARLIRLVETLGNHPEQSIPDACDGDRAAIKATYRFFESEAIDPDAIMAAQRDATVGRCAAYPLILAVQDTTELNFTSHPGTQGLGHLRAAQQQGFLVHSVLALSPTGVPLGVPASAAVGTRSHQPRRTDTAEAGHYGEGEPTMAGCGSCNAGCPAPRDRGADHRGSGGRYL